MTTTDSPGGLPLPQDIPFQLLAASPDMMDVRFCNKRFPFEFRSSIAIYAHEPKDLPEPFCAGRITYLKVAVSITGYKPTKFELDNYDIVGFPGAPTEHDFEDFQYITRKYFPCFGALLNVAIFPPGGNKTSLTRYPHIVAFEPKSRDLMVPTTLDGEILSQSSDRIHTDFSARSTKTTKLELSPSMKIEKPPLTAELKGTLSNQTTKEVEQSSGTEIDSTTAFKRGFSTNIEQMYNMLTGYHVGTNRATFLMLPYPHIVQPTEFRTFAQGIRVLEGIQEFFLIVARPADMTGFCVEAGLQTGHFPEDVEIIPAKPVYTTDAITLNFALHVDKGEESTSRSVPFPPGFILDTSRGNAGIDNVDIGSNNPGIDDWDNTGDISVTPNGIIVSATGHKRPWGGPGSIINRNITVYIRSVEQIGEIAKHADVEDLLITSRSLCVCVKSAPPCLEVLSVSVPQLSGTLEGRLPDGREIVDETRVRLRGTLDPEKPPVKELLAGVRNALFTSGQQPARYENGTMGFFDSRYFAKQWLAVLPEAHKERRIGDFKEIPELREHLACMTPAVLELSVAQAATMPARTFAERSGLSLAAAISVRRRLLGIGEVRRPPNDQAAAGVPGKGT